jgi:DNA mismatch repair protein MutS
MAGKSTVMRQAALCVLMAQMGGFVPASSARIGLCDRLFTRVGASDNLGRGHSTFMVEMMETATILKHATCQSLVLLDEIGRGTSTFDGLAIAMSVAEYLHDKVRCRTLFATHYHELCKLADKHPQMVNVQMAVGHHGEELIFLRSLVAGAADKSYGVEVARLAGLPPAVLRRAKALLQVMERDERRRQPQLALFPSDAVPTELPPARVPLAAPAQNSLQHKLAMLDPNHLTPLQALTALAELKQVVEERRGD